ncbi:MAG: hypothetical protein OXG11_07305 [Chloroflexi bacterium]|nr:hypothetical protein [Chloroflexota bacterium]
MGANYLLLNRTVLGILGNISGVTAREEARYGSRARKYQERDDNRNVLQETHCTKNRSKTAPRR